MTIASAYSAAEIATFERLRAAGATPAAIAKALGRSRHSVIQRIERLDLRQFYAATAHEHTGLSVPAGVLAEREARRALEPRDLTARLCGDPPPGYSALDRAQRGAPP